ncbi:type II toxin-antitoxin system RelB/DinJ family antitoxin [Cupriavidus necator]
MLEPALSASTFVRARIDAQIKEEAAAVLAAMGLTVSSEQPYNGF